MRRAEALHPAAFLIDQDGRFPAEDIAEVEHVISVLLRRANVAFEKDAAPWTGLTQKRALIGGNR
jgi:hypothetical protein